MSSYTIRFDDRDLAVLLAALSCYIEHNRDDLADFWLNYLEKRRDYEHSKTE